MQKWKYTVQHELMYNTIVKVVAAIIVMSRSSSSSSSRKQTLWSVTLFLKGRRRSPWGQKGIGTLLHPLCFSDKEISKDAKVPRIDFNKQSPAITILKMLQTSFFIRDLLKQTWWWIPEGNKHSSAFGGGRKDFFYPCRQNSKGLKASLMKHLSLKCV